MPLKSVPLCGLTVSPNSMQQVVGCISIDNFFPFFFYLFFLLFILTCNINTYKCAVKQNWNWKIKKEKLEKGFTQTITKDLFK